MRHGEPEDYEKVIDVLIQWWNGRDLTHLILKLFFQHFQDTIYIAENEREIVGFLIGFLSQSQPQEGYIHFLGVHPEYRKSGLGRELCARFWAHCRKAGRKVVRSITSPVNIQSIAFHLRLGYTIEPGDSEINGVPVTSNYHRENDPKVLFKKALDQQSGS